MYWNLMGIQVIVLTINLCILSICFKFTYFYFFLAITLVTYITMTTSEKFTINSHIHKQTGCTDEMVEKVS